MNKKPFYITTTLPYVNAEPHIGFAMEIIRADIIARVKKLAGHEVFFNTGTDEHGVKIYQKAFHFNEDTQAFVDRYVIKFRELKDVLGLSDDIHFIRTTDRHHTKAAQEFWRRCDANGFIYKKLYKTKYCPGCELEITDTELENGHCFIHPTTELILIDEENYFFRFSAFQKQLLDLYLENPLFVIPDFRLNEIKVFVGRGLEDFSISRLATKMPWGIPVPNDSAHVMYVWFDALINYVSTVGWPDDEIAGKKSAGAFKKWWVETGGVVQYCGKDNLRQQSAMWQAMLMAAGLPPSHTIVINGFITGEGGLKMSKSLGNTVDPVEIVREYGTDALRYYVARGLSPFGDSPFTMEKFKEGYNAHLANGIGNLTSRILKMAETNEVWIDTGKIQDSRSKIQEKNTKGPVDWVEFDKKLAGFEINKVCDEIWERIMKSDKYIAENAPFKLIKENRVKGEKAVKYLLEELWLIANLLTPILPNTSETIKKLIIDKKTPVQPLFARK